MCVARRGGSGGGVSPPLRAENEGLYWEHLTSQVLEPTIQLIMENPPFLGENLATCLCLIMLAVIPSRFTECVSLGGPLGSLLETCRQPQVVSKGWFSTHLC